MRQLTMTKQQARILGLNLESKAQGYSHKELKLLDAVIDAIDEALGEYQQRIEGIAKAFKAKRRDAGTDMTELAKLADEESRAVEAINEEDGERKIELLLEDKLYDFAKEQWEAMSNFRGNREARKVVLALDAAVRTAEKVRPVKVEKVEAPAEASAETVCKDC